MTELHALVTGGARGIGAAIAHRLAADGLRVTVLSRSGAAAHGLHAVAADVADAQQVQEAMHHAQERHGPIQILVNNAGQAESAPFAKMDEALWRRMLDVNLTGTMLCTQAVLPGMLQAGWGRIVNVASTAGQVGYAYVAAYCAAKHGVIGLTRSLALELAAKGITVNAVCPGYTETDIVRDSIARVVAKTGRTQDEARAEFVKSNPQGRLVDPAEVADAVAWLCGRGAGAVTGQSVSVSGGEVM
ncbi:SDR family NAD(P)-dependent oxidoreductase [Acidovorax sp. 106]|jgi:NAD(P)-dependent dehydrogenase (short-subunit alcohol dehydrogenase family)|uniref:SDR family NAD(P)-dependent oxidoreductase n=1 Tax=Acidovorax sp. 106 TaxID=2135637 RepID=UPI000EACFF2E|nr:SDR family NAD(P)-dependent oxidoreductase [Acidovorax sp. 106]RLJ37982.1 NAD(P)-dependent dehydrogenase (short-subunit alcohol dehydrogenase family) [Acidovorax sp. 106]